MGEVLHRQRELTAGSLSEIRFRQTKGLLLLEAMRPSSAGEDIKSGLAVLNAAQEGTLLKTMVQTMKALSMHKLCQ